VNNLYHNYRYTQITQQTKLRVEPVELVVSSVSSRVVRQAQGKMHGLHTSNVSSHVVSSQVEFGLYSRHDSSEVFLAFHNIPTLNTHTAYQYVAAVCVATMNREDLAIWDQKLWRIS